MSAYNLRGMTTLERLRGWNLAGVIDDAQYTVLAIWCARIASRYIAS